MPLCHPSSSVWFAKGRHLSIDAYSNATLRTRDGRCQMHLTSGEDAGCSQHAVTLCPLSTRRLMRRCRPATLQHLSFRHQLWPGLISTTVPASWQPGTRKDGVFSRISTLEKSAVKSWVKFTKPTASSHLSLPNFVKFSVKNVKILHLQEVLYNVIQENFLRVFIILRVWTLSLPLVWPYINFAQPPHISS